MILYNAQQHNGTRKCCVLSWMEEGNDFDSLGEEELGKEEGEGIGSKVLAKPAEF